MTRKNNKIHSVGAQNFTKLTWSLDKIDPHKILMEHNIKSSSYKIIKDPVIFKYTAIKDAEIETRRLMNQLNAKDMKAFAFQEKTKLRAKLIAENLGVASENDFVAADCTKNVERKLSLFMIAKTQVSSTHYFDYFNMWILHMY